MSSSKIVAFIRHPRNRLFRWLLAAVVVLNLLDLVPLVIDKHHAHTAAEAVPGFWTVFGLVGCIVIILVSKWFGHTGIMTREDYYDE